MTIDFSNIKESRPLFIFDPKYNLMRSFIQHTEESINVSIDRYKENGPEVEIIEISPEEGIYQKDEHYQGLHSHELNSQDMILDDIFENYFPSVQRRSALITLVGIYEHELERFCDMYAEKHDSPIKLNELKGKGLKRINLFVKKIIGLDNSTVFPNIKKIVKLRNSCVHNDAKIKKKDGQPIKAINELINDPLINVNPYGGQFRIGEGFLIYVLNQFNAYTNEIEETINKK